MKVSINVKQADKDREIALKDGSTILGRGADCDLRIPIEACSRQHCEIRKEKDMVYVKDLDSANGIFVNSEKVAESEVENGDALSIGPVIIEFIIEGQPDNFKKSKRIKEIRDKFKEKKESSILI